MAQAETRRLAALMFTDMVGFSARWAPMKPACCGCWRCITRSSSRPKLFPTGKRQGREPSSARPMWKRSVT